MNTVKRAREALGLRLRELRRNARLSGKQLAELLQWAPSKVSKLQLGQQTPTEEDVRAWVAATRGGDQLEDLLASLRTLETHYAEWRRQLRSGVARRQRELLDLASTTTVSRCFEPVVVPGLLQTAAYAQHRFERGAALHDAPADVEAAVAARMRRQELLYQPGRQFHFVITEAVLRYHLYPAEVLAGQLDRLLALISMPNLRLGIVPFQTDYPVTPLHGFWIYDDKLVLVETLAAELNLAQPQEVRFYSAIYRQLAQVALYTSAARALVTAALQDLPQQGSDKLPQSLAK